MPRNLIVRVGLDASGYHAGLAKMPKAAESVSKKVNKALSQYDISQNVGKAMGWSGKVSDAVTQVNSTNIAQAQQQLADLTAYKQQMESIGFDANSTDPQYGAVSERIRELTYDIKAYEDELQRQAAAQQQAAQSARDASQQTVQAAYQAADAKRAEVVGVSAIDRVSDAILRIPGIPRRIAVGIKNISMVADDTAEIISYKLSSAIRSMPSVPRMILSGLKSIGSLAGRVAVTGVKGLGYALKNVGKWVSNIGSRAKSSNGSIGQMVTSLRQVALASVAFRLAGSAMGRLRSIVSEYISENETLQAQVNGLKAGMGQALAPAINLVVSAMSKLLPYVLGVSNAIGQLMGALFGEGWTAAANGAKKTAAATSSAAKAQKEMNRQLMSFDEINKLNDNSSSDSGGGGSAADNNITPISSTMPAWMENFKNSFSELFNSEEFKASSIGGKVGVVVDTLSNEINRAFSAVHFTEIGEMLGQQFTDCVSKINWGTLGDTIGLVLVSLPSVIVGFIYGTDWALVGQSLSDMLSSAFATVNEWMRAVDWLKIGDSLWQLISNVDWSSLASGLFTFLGLAVGGLVGILWPTISNCAKSIGDFFSEKIKEAGGSIPKGLFLGIKEGLGIIGNWINKNICEPFVSGFKDAFGIHSPSTVLAELGEYLMKGLTGGISTGIAWVMDKLNDLKEKIFSIADKLKEAFSFEWKMPTLKLPHLSVEWDPVDNLLSKFLGVSAIPRLSVSWFAKGGILNGAQIFGRMGSSLLGGGEAGREAVLPLESNTGWMDNIADRVVSRLAGQDGGDVNATIYLILDGEVLDRRVIKGLRKYARANGGLGLT